MLRRILLVTLLALVCGSFVGCTKEEEDRGTQPIPKQRRPVN